MLALQTIACLFNLANPHLIWSLLICAILIYQFVRFRGFYNGGADAMTFVVLFSSTAALCFPSSEKYQSIFLWYIGIQVILSYFIAGVAKAKHKDWWTGYALTHAMTSSVYLVPTRIQKLIQGRLAQLLSILLIFFELIFPLALIDKTATDIFIVVAVVFHLGNFFVFGLNRFVFAWLAAYPAVYLLANRLHQRFSL